MKPLFTLSTALLLLASTQAVTAQDVTISFDDTGLPADTAVTANAMRTDTTFTFEGVQFPSRYDTSFGGFWSGGWALSTSRDDTTVTFRNLTGSAAGGDASGEVGGGYMVGQNGAYVLLPSGNTFGGLSFTNIAYTADVVENGSQFSRAFGTDSTGAQAQVADSLVLQLTGYLGDNITFVKSYALADYKFAADDDDYIQRDWASDSTSLVSQGAPSADSVVFRMFSSVNGEFGNNTPDFFAIDNFRFGDTFLSVANASDIQPLACYPNPANTTIHFGNGEGLAELRIFNSAGQVVARHSAYRGGSPYELTALAPGLYLAQLKSAEGISTASFYRQ